VFKGKPCSERGAPAQFSLVVVLSTLGVTPRTQKCARAILRCKSCLQALLAGLKDHASPSLAESLSQAFTAIAGTSGRTEDHPRVTSSQKENS